MSEDVLRTYCIQVRFNAKSNKLSKKWLDDNCKGTWAIGKNTDSYDLQFDNAEDALLTWWKWA